MIGIVGGTFDPVHYGHLKPAEAVMHALSLAQMRFIPNRNPPHRAQPWLSIEQRLTLLELALQDYPAFTLDLREIERDGLSYMVDTMGSLKQSFPGEALCLILGQDAFNGFEHWYRWQDILQYCHLVVTPRPGVSVSGQNVCDELKSRFTSEAQDLRLQKSGRILLQSVPQLDISSTVIRQRLSAIMAVSDGDGNVDASLAELMPVKVFEQLKRFFEND